MQFFRKSQPATEPAAPAAPADAPEAPEPTPILRRVHAGDADFGHVVASLTTPPGAAREEAAARHAAAMAAPGEDGAWEYFVLDGLDGAPVGALSLHVPATETGVVVAWGGVDPVVRRFGMGALLLERATKRAQELGATTLRARADQQSGYAFLLDNGFAAVDTQGGTVTGELAVPVTPSA